MPGKWEKGVRTRRRRLSLRHERLVDLYFGPANFCKSKALRMCGYAHPHKYTRLFDHPAVAEEIERRHREVRERHRVDFDRVQDEIAKIAFFSIYDVARLDEATGDLLLDFRHLDAAAAAAIGEVTVEVYTEGSGDEAREVKRVRVKPWNKLDALDKLMRHGGLSKDKGDAALGDLAERLRAALSRVGGKDANTPEDVPNGR